MGRQVQRTVYLPTELDGEVDDYLEETDDFDSFASMVRYSVRQTMQQDELKE